MTGWGCTPQSPGEVPNADVDADPKLQWGKVLDGRQTGMRKGYVVGVV